MRKAKGPAARTRRAPHTAKLPQKNRSTNHNAVSAAATEKFLRKFYLSKLKALGRDVRVGLFTLPEKLSFWSSNPSALAKWATRKTLAGQHVYFHCHGHDFPEGESAGRGNRESVVAAICVATDIDAVGPGRKKSPKLLCPSVEAARGLIKEFNRRRAPLKIGLVINSGYGVYPFLLFDKPFIINTRADRDHLESLSRRFHQALAQIAAEKGWPGAVEFCDLAKVLRLPGTINSKDKKHPKSVRVVEENAARFDIAELDRRLPAIVGGVSTSKKAKPVGDQIPEGERNATLASRAGTMRHSGFSGEAIEAALLAENGQHCKPPLAEDEVRGIAASIAKYPTGAANATQAASGNGSQATQIVSLAKPAELFHTADGEAYAALEIDKHREIRRLKDPEVKRWLASKYFLQNRAAPSSSAMADALGVLEGKALYEGPEHEVFTRIARVGDAIYLDLANANWQAVKITAEGWTVVDRPSVRFRRPRGMMELPEPCEGGSFDELWEFVNVQKKTDRIILASWLLGAFQYGEPFSALVLVGEQGTAKSTLARMLRKLIDPNKAELRAQPREERDLSIAAKNGWMIAFDNVSRLPPWLSDALCRLATGGGFGTRELYSDDQETLFDAKRPLLLNGIEGFVVRGDLLDRSLIVELKTIPPENRRPEQELWAGFRKAQPSILGALLDVVAAALRNAKQIDLEELPRMADFALWAAAGEAAFGFPQGSVIRAIRKNQAEANALPLDTSPIVPPLRSLLSDHTVFEGTATDLLLKLERHASNRSNRSSSLPRTAQGLGSALSRLAPNLRAAGVLVTFQKTAGTGSQRIIRIEDRTGNFSDASDASDADESDD
jgi:hypothetical protein